MTAGRDGLTGQWLSLEEVAALDLFASQKRAFKLKLAANLGAAPGQGEPGIKAAVRREYRKGDVICEAGAFGSTAFLLLSGSATAFVPERASARPVAGRNRWSLGRLTRALRRHRGGAEGPVPADAVGELSRHATLVGDHRLPPTALSAGDVFGVDACINFYPREATVRADEPCVVLEMLRSMLDSVREGGGGGEAIDGAYQRAAIRNTLYVSSLFRELTVRQLDAVADAAELWTPDADAVRDGVICAAGAPADAVFVVRAGTVKIVEPRPEGERIVSYVGRGGAFGLEALLPRREQVRVALACVSHPGVFGSIDLGGPLVLGRSASCDVVFPAEERGVGRRHCRFEERAGDLYVIDLDSANFTLLNGERVREALVTLGDQITIVDYTFEIVRAAPADTPDMLPPRVAAAIGLDNFEVVRVPLAAFFAVTEHAGSIREATGAAARALEGSMHQRLGQEQRLDEAVGLSLYNAQNALIIDLDRCTRCDECVRACADAHDGVARFTRDGPRVGRYMVALACRSCTDPKCMIGCPVGSIRRTDSLEIRIEDWCIGCERCANQCPFGNINMVEAEAPAAVPAAEPSPAQRATVCDLCAGYDGPSCVYACPHDAAIRVEPASFLAEALRR
jgi:Fe-S-cluster-containing hydrogenase component 2/CRP-like cAMP-binding protein